MRYVMRIARLRNHQNFERTLRFQDMPGSMLGWVSVNPARPLPCVMSLSMMLSREYLCYNLGLHWSEWSDSWVKQLATVLVCRLDVAIKLQQENWHLVNVLMYVKIMFRSLVVL